MTDRDAARTAKEQLRTELARLPGVTGIGLGRRQDDYVITVTVTEQATCEHVPARFHGVTVEVRVSGQVRALDDGRSQPSPGGTGPARTPSSAVGDAPPP